MTRKRLSLPDPIQTDFSPIKIDWPSKWLIIGDIHLPNHHNPTLKIAVKTAKKHKVSGILFNGDILDSHQLSKFCKDPLKPRYEAEVKLAKHLFDWFREQFPEADMIFKEGNHEERLQTYIMDKAPALFGIDEFRLPYILGLGQRGIEHVADKRLIRMGRLNVVHGHEFPRAISNPVNPARGLFLRAKKSALCNHFHQVTEHAENDVTGVPISTWSIGCACDKNPPYMPLNNWGHGFAIVEVLTQDRFVVQNFRCWHGKLTYNEGE